MTARRTLALHLALTPGMGGRRVSRTMARIAVMGLDPERFLKLSAEAMREEFGLPEKVAERLVDRSRWDDARRAIERLEVAGIALVTAADATYPERVESFDPEHPGVLFLYGNRSLLTRETFSVLCSRGAGPGAIDEIEVLTEQGVMRGEVPVSGHDRPEYQRAATVPLRWGAPRILVFDRGHFQCLGEGLDQEPFRAARLWRHRFDAQVDLAISPFRPDAGFHGVNNQVRDRLVGALSSRLDFVHIAASGGMAKVAKLALKAGRPVRVPLSEVDWLSQGADALP